MSNLKEINSQQKHAIRIIYNKKKYETVQELLRSIKISNVYQIKILNKTFNASNKHKNCTNCISIQIQKTFTFVSN